MGIFSKILRFLLFFPPVFFLNTKFVYSYDLKINPAPTPVSPAPCNEILPLKNFDPLIEAAYHEKCDTFDRDPKNSCAYQEYLRRKKAQTTTTANPLAGLQNSVSKINQTDVLDKNKTQIEKLLQAYSKAQCGGMGAKLKVTNELCENNGGWCGKEEMAYDLRYQFTDFCSRDDYQKALALKEKEARDTGDYKALREFNRKFKNDFVDIPSVSNATSYYSSNVSSIDQKLIKENKSTKQKDCFDKRKDSFLAKAKSDNENLGSSIQKSVDYYENKKDSKLPGNLKICEDAVLPSTIENRASGSGFIQKQEAPLERSCEVADRVGYKDNESNSDNILKSTTSKSIQDCIDTYKNFGYVPTKAVILTSSNLENNAFTPSQTCCSKDFKCLSDSRATEIKTNTEKFFTDQNISGVAVTTNSTGRNGDGTTGPCPYTFTDDDIQNGIASEKKKSLTAVEKKQLETSKYGIISVRFVQKDLGSNYSNKQMGRQIEQKCISFSPMCAY